MIRQLKDMWGCKAKLFHIYAFREVIFETVGSGILAIIDIIFIGFTVSLLTSNCVCAFLAELASRKDFPLSLKTQRSCEEELQFSLRK